MLKIFAGRMLERRPAVFVFLPIAQLYHLQIPNPFFVYDEAY